MTALWTFDDPGSPSEGASPAQLQGTAVTGNTTSPLLGGSYRGDDGAFVRGVVTPPASNLPWSVSLWFRSDSDIGATDNLVGWMWQQGFALQTLHNSNGRLAFDSGTTSYTWQTASPMDGQWHHAALTSATGSAPYILYLDGVRLANPTSSTITNTGNLESYFLIGTGGNRGTNNARDWDGWIDDTAVFDAAVTGELASALHGMGRLGIPAAESPVVQSLLGAASGTIMTIAGKPWERVASGLGGGVGSYSGTVAAGDAKIVTTASGAGLRMVVPYAGLAAVDAGPASFDETTGFGQAVNKSFTVANTSNSAPLEWDMVGPPGIQPDLDAAARQFDIAKDSILAEISSRFQKVPEIIPASGVLQDIPYQSNGNRHAFSTFNSGSPKDLPLVPGQTVVTTKEDFSVTGTVRHTTRVAEGFVVLSADCTNVTKLEVNGNLATSPVNPLSSSATLTVHGLKWKAWLYRISRMNGPVVHHVFLTPDDPAITGTTAGATTENFVLNNLPASCRIHHLWFTREFTVFPESTMLAVAKRFLEATHAPAPWLQPAKSGQLAGPGGSAIIPLRFDSAGLAPGTYHSSYCIVPKGMDAASVPAGDFTASSFTVVAPEFTAAGPVTELSVLPDLAQHGEKIVLTPAAGVTLGAVTASSGASWLKAVPSENRPGEVDLTFDTTGLAAGSYSTTVTVIAGFTTQVVTINIKVETPNYVAMLADPGRNSVYLLHSGSPSRLLVLDAVKGSVIREIQVPGAYLMTLSRDGSFLHMLRKPDNHILSLDLQRMTLGAPVPLGPEVTRTNELFSNLDSGPNGTLYFINSDYASSLYAVNARTGSVIQRLDLADRAETYFGRFRVSADASRLYSLHYKGETASTLLPPVYTWQISADGSLTPQPATETAWIGAIDFSATGIASMVNSADGRLLGMADRVFTPGNFQGTNRQFPEQVKAISAEGGFVVGDRRIYDAGGNTMLADMPLPQNPKSIAITPEGRVFYAASFRYGFVDVPAMGGAEAAGIRVFPAPGSQGPAPAGLSWLPVDGARDYRIYLSQSAYDLEGSQPAAAAAQAKSSAPRIVNPVAMAAGETWYWRVDAMGPAGLVRGTVRSFGVTDFGVPGRRMTVDVVKGCKAQPIVPPLLLPPGASPTLTVGKPWLKVAASGNSFEVDSTLVPGSGDTATLGYTLHGTQVAVPLQVRLHLTDHQMMLTGPATSRAFTLVKSRSVNDPNNYYGPFFVTRLDPANGDMLECLNAGFRARSLALSRDESELAVESGVSLPGTVTGGVDILKAADFSRLKHLLATSGYNSSSGDLETALSAGGKIFTGSTLLNWQTGAILGHDTTPVNPLSAFSPDGKSLYGGEVNSVFRHDATLPNLPQTASFSRRYGGTDRILMSQDGSLLLYGNMFFDANLQLLRSSDFVALRTNAEASVVAGSSGIYHTRSLRKIADLPGDQVGQYVRLGFCDAAKTLVYYIPGNSGVPDYSVLPLEPLLKVDGSTLVPEIPDGSLYSGQSVILKWSDMPAADSFRVFFGTDQAAVAAAGPGSPLELGVISAAQWSQALPLLKASTYFWKVIAQGPGGTSSSPVWSFVTPSLSLAKASMKVLCPVASNSTEARNSISVASPGTSWSLTTTAPWIELPQPGGTGSGDFIIRVNPTGFLAGSQQGTVIVTSNGETATLSVTMQNYGYATVDHLAEKNGPFFHVFVCNRDSNGNGPLYLMKVNSETLQHVETLDLGINYTNAGNLLTCHHPADGRVYFIYANSGRLIGVNTAAYRIETDVPIETPRGEICPAGPGRLAWIKDAVGLTVNEATSGNQIAVIPVSFGNSPRLAGNPAGDRFYLFTATISPTLRRYDFSGTQLTAGPVASSLVGTTGDFGISEDGNTIFYRQGFYNPDLSLAGQLSDGISNVSADGSRFLLRNISSPPPLRLVTRAGTVLGWLPQFSSSKVSWNQQTGRIYQRPRGSAYQWADTSNLDGLPLPALSGGRLWTSSGGQPWTHTSDSPQVMRTPRTFDPAFSDLGRQPMLTFVAPVSGTLSFEVRNLGSGTDSVSLTVDNTAVDTVGPVASFVTRSRAISAGNLVGISYFTNSINPYAEFRNITFTPAAGAAPPLAIAPVKDKDGDGADDLLEAALGTDSDNPASRPVTRIVPDGDLRVFEFQRPAGLPYRYQVQVSSDLVEWVDLSDPFSIQVTDGLEQVRIPIPQSGKCNFARLNVTPLAN